MNNFSLLRIIRLMQREIANHWRKLLLVLATIFGIFLVFFTSIGLSGQFETYKRLIADGNIHYTRDFFLPHYFSGMIFFGLLYIGMAFPDFRSKRKTITFLTLPANTSEKFVSMFLLTTIGFLLVYTAGFYIFNIAAIIIAKVLGDVDLNFLNFTIVDFKEAFKIFFLLHAFFFLGATVFKKVPVLISGIILSLLFMATTIIFPLFINSFIDGDVQTNFDELFFTLRHYEPFKIYEMTWLNSFISYAAAPILWLTAFFKLKEKEI